MTKGKHVTVLKYTDVAVLKQDDVVLSTRTLSLHEQTMAMYNHVVDALRTAGCSPMACNAYYFAYMDDPKAVPYVKGFIDTEVEILKLWLPDLPEDVSRAVDTTPQDVLAFSCGCPDIYPDIVVPICRVLFTQFAQEVGDGVMLETKSHLLSGEFHHLLAQKVREQGATP